MMTPQTWFLANGSGHVYRVEWELVGDAKGWCIRDRDTGEFIDGAYLNKRDVKERLKEIRP